MFHQQTTARDLLGVMTGGNATWTYTPPSIASVNIEAELKRIADALEKLVPPADERMICHFCGTRFDFGEVLGYGTTYDGKRVCADCLQVALDSFSGKE